MRSLRQAKLFGLSQVVICFGYMVKKHNPTIAEMVSSGGVFASTLLDMFTATQDEEFLDLADDMITAHAELGLIEARNQGFDSADIIQYLSLPQMRLIVREAIEGAGYDTWTVSESFADDLVEMAKDKGRYVHQKVPAVA